MKNKQYYIDLSDRWFDALLTGDGERELKAFLASTDDPDFDEVKAVAGFFAAGKAVHGEEKRRKTMHRLIWAVAAMAASLAIFAAIGGLYEHRQNECYVLAYGDKSTDPERALAEMSATLAGIFAEGEDVGEELFYLFNPGL